MKTFDQHAEHKNAPANTLQANKATARFIDHRASTHTQLKLQGLADTRGTLPAIPASSLKTTSLNEGSTHPIVQGVFDFRNFDEATEKFNDLYNGLVGTENKYLHYLHRHGNVRVTLEDKADENPGDASLIIRESEGGKWVYRSISAIREIDTIYGIGAVVNIRKWYFDKYPAGKILSMLAHEIGVHIVPYMDELMSKLPGAEETEIDTSKQPGKFGISDHLRVADIEHEDFRLYRNVVNDMMKAMMRYNDRETGEEKAIDLADGYLMDISTFTKTGGRLKFPLNPKAVATKYNQYSKVAKLTVSPPDKTAKGVRSDYSLLYRMVLPQVAKHYPGRTAAVAVFAAILVLCLIYYFIRLFI